MATSKTIREKLEKKLNDQSKTQKLIDEINTGINLTQKDYESHVDKVLDKYNINDPKLSTTIAKQVRPV